MPYAYRAFIGILNSSGRFANLTQTPTLAAYDTAGNAISSPTWAYLGVTGMYKASVTHTAATDVLFRVAVHADDQANFDDVLALHDRMEFVLDDKLDLVLEDTGTTIPAAIDAVPTAAETWANATRTLTMSAAEVTAAVSGTSITQTRGNSWSIEITGLTLYSTKIQFALKNSYTDPDIDAVLFIDTATGLVRVNGAAGTAADASLSYAGTTLTVVVDASVTALLPAGGYKYGIQGINVAGLVAESYGGEFIIGSDIVHATS